MLQNFQDTLLRAVLHDLVVTWGRGRLIHKTIVGAKASNLEEGRLQDDGVGDISAVCHMVARCCTTQTVLHCGPKHLQG